MPCAANLVAGGGMNRAVALRTCVAQPCCIGFGRRLLADFRSATAACMVFGLGRTRAMVPQRGCAFPALPVPNAATPRQNLDSAAVVSASPPPSAHRPVGNLTTAEQPGNRSGLPTNRSVARLHHPTLPSVHRRSPSRTIVTRRDHLQRISPLRVLAPASSTSSLRCGRALPVTDFFQINGGVHA